MTKEKARKLIKQYVDGWKENNTDKILEVLTADCRIIESHGPIYKGVKKIKKWVEMWKQSNGKVKRWNITSFYFIKDIAFFEWIFNCSVNHKNYYIEGITIVRFKDVKISYLREYRMTKRSFEWNEKKIET